MGKPVKVKKDNYNFINIIAVIACLSVIVVILTVLFASYIFDKTSEPAGEQSRVESSAEDSSAASSEDEGSDQSEDSSESDTVSDTSSEVSDPGGYVYVPFEFNAIHSGDLIVVNNDYQYDFNQNAPLVSIYENRTGNYKLIDGSLKISSSIITSLNEMLDGLYGAVGSNSLTLTVAYRDSAEQQAVYDQGKDTAIGGGSDLHTGLSFKCTVYPSSDGSLTEGKFLWLAENCKYYGFVLRYPEGKTSITDYDASPNFFRYVGKPHAYLMTLNQYCLEEYIDFCRRFSYENQYKVEYDGVKYAIYYCEAASSGITQVKIPEGAEYTVSGDNSSGFIVTVTLS
ncbi:MAG: D-alanyl-D-alanine carboxypeptidase family protein [Eubacteriales bacterium]|nr:D-alanyl-D-alanine carboxypeptidase family protein [Eubacteriales bacterium]